jgi:hypothetical protein
MPKAHPQNGFTNSTWVPVQERHHPVIAATLLLHLHVNVPLPSFLFQPKQKSYCKISLGTLYLNCPFTCQITETCLHLKEDNAIYFT